MDAFFDDVRIKAKQMWDFAVMQNKHSDTLILTFFSSFVLFIVLYVVEYNNLLRDSKLQLFVSALTFLIILIFSYKSVEKTMRIDLTVWCNKDIDIGETQFNVNVENRIYIVLSFVYYYIIMFARALIYSIMVMVTLYVVYILLCAQHRYPMCIMPYSNTPNASSRNFVSIVFVVGCVAVAIVGLAMKKYIMVAIPAALLAERISLLLVGGLIAKDSTKMFALIPLHGIKNFIAPDVLLKFVDFSDLRKMRAHLNVFIIGLVLSILYASIVIKRPKTCADEEGKKLTNAQFMHGFLIMFTFVIALYIVEVFTTMMN